MKLDYLLGEPVLLDKHPKKESDLLQPFDTKSVVEKIIDRLTTAILAKELKAGQKIPTEMELCDSLRVGRNSVREAIKTMVAMGLLVIRRSEGTFVSDGFSERMLDPMIYGLILSDGDPYSVIELRKLFDTGVLQLAIQKRNDEDLTRLNTALEELIQVVRETPEENAILDQDIVFHRIIGEIAGNPLADKISLVIERLTLPSRVRAVRRFLDRSEHDSFIRKHQDMFHVVVNRDDGAVARVIDDHYTHWKSVSIRTQTIRE